MVERAAIEIGAFHEQVRKRARCAELAELRPQASLEHGGMQVEDTLALHEGVHTDGVIAGRKRGDLDAAPTLASVAAIPL